MKTEYQSRKDGRPVHNQWTTDLQFVRENCRPNGAELFKRETETAEEAALRRENWLERENIAGRIYIPKGESIRAHVDRKCPPPKPTEVRIDWDTLEPVKEVPVWFSDMKKVWAAGIDQRDWFKMEPMDMAHAITSGKVAIGPTREAALRNLEELRRAAK